MKLQELSTDEKLGLAQALWDSVAFDQGALALTEQQKRTLDQRLAEFELDGDPGAEWHEVKRRLLKD